MILGVFCGPGGSDGAPGHVIVIEGELGGAHRASSAGNGEVFDTGLRQLSKLHLGVFQLHRLPHCEESTNKGVN